MSYSILFEFQVLGFMCNIYCIVLFVLGFKAPLRRCLWPMLWRQHQPIVRYLHVGIPMMQRLHQRDTRGPMGSRPPLVVTQIARSYPQFGQNECYFGLQDVKLTIYFLSNHIFTIITCSPFQGGVVLDLGIFAHFCSTCHPFFFCLKHFTFIIHHLVLIIRIHSHIFIYVCLIKLSK